MSLGRSDTKDAIYRESEFGEGLQDETPAAFKAVHLLIPLWPGLRVDLDPFLLQIHEPDLGDAGAGIERRYQPPPLPAEHPVVRDGRQHRNQGVASRGLHLAEAQSTR